MKCIQSPIRDITEWAEAWQWAGGRTSKKKYTMPKSQRPDGTVADSSKRLASRFYQLKTGHCLSRWYLRWTKDRPTTQCWWCRCQEQRRGRLFKVRPEWKGQQKILWAEVSKGSGRRKHQSAIQDLLADERCSQAVLDFLSTTDVRRLVPTEEDAEREAWEWDLGEGAAGELGAGRVGAVVSTHILSWHLQMRNRGGSRFLCSPGGSFFGAGSFPS